MKPGMFHNANPSIFEKAKHLRTNMTVAEKKLWRALSSSKIESIRFKSQHPFGNFIADFYCHKAKLIIEVDGEIHFNADNKEYDNYREEEIEALGIKVIRFTNYEVLHNTEKVIEEIRKELINRIHPSLPPTP